MQVSAQWPGYKSFKLEEDNKAVRINTLQKINKGYIYAGTSNGLYKFDGDKFTRINFENKDYNDSATAVFQDNKLQIWVGFNSGRIAHVINGNLVYYNPEEGSPHKKITSFLQDKENNIWFSCYGEGIYHIKKNHLYLINTDDGLSDANVSSLSLADNGDILAATDQGINICNITGDKKTLSVIGPKQGLPDYIVTCISKAGKDLFWIGLQDKGFCLYDHHRKQIILPKGTTGWTYGQVNAVLPEPDNIWIATQENGLLKYNVSSGILLPVEEAAGYKNINALLQDNQSNIWLSTSDHGLVRSPGERLKLIPLVNTPVFEHIHAILSDKSGNIWLNDENNGLVKYMLKDGRYSPKKIMLKGLGEKTDITSLYQDIFGNIWIGTMGKGIYILDPRDEHYRVFSENSIFNNASILSINGHQNTIYASSLQGSMVIELSAVNSNINSTYSFDNYDNNSTGTNYIYTIFKDSKDRIWFATDGKGLSMLDKNVFTYYNDKKQIRDDHIYSITEDKTGNIWFSTSSAGIYKFDGKTFTNYIDTDGLSDLSVSALKTDRAGNIVIVHKKGLDILNPVTGDISYINSNQGIAMINAEDLGAVTQDTLGNIMVSTTNGILSYSPSENSLQKPTTIIESVQLFLRDIDENRNPRFSHDENSFTFNYTGLYYSDPERVYYEYKLEGLDSNWVLTKDRSKTFSKLEPGGYTFHIRSSLNKNFRNADEDSYHFVIEEAFYKTAWFIIICLIVISLLLFWYVKNREARLKNIERFRQEKIQFQFAVLRNQVNPHFLFNSFNTLISIIEDEPEMAVEFVEHLSDFFRHIVNYRDKDVIPLKEEIELLQTYFFIQQKRLGNSLKLVINLTDLQKSENNIPPLTLQLLVENAIKHNAVSKETPLTISIDIDGNEQLNVSNNKNLRISKQAGAGMGLQNIISRYNLLSNKAVKITDDTKYFIVSLPLLTT